VIYRLIDKNTIEEGLDRQNLVTLRRRFLSINQDRLERMRGALSDRQQLFMDALPILFHTNHPMMPGFVSRRTPARISNYKPSKRDVIVGKMIAKSFTVNYEPNMDDDILGIYVMGSVGTIAQSERSDLDIWICHRPSLAGKLVDELNTKCGRITEWAAKKRLEVHFFLMDNEAFKQGELSALNAESSGSAQKILLLEEFYRSAIFIEGRTPIWWYVPDHEENNFKHYADTLLRKRFIPDTSVLDFGGITTIPAGEFLGAGIWQLYKAIESPHKSALKLLLLEAYVAEYPNIRPLSLTFKSSIYQGVEDIDALDSYVMIYRRIEEYLLERKQYKRLELARRCFYFKVNKPLSNPPTSRSKSWQRILLEHLTREWNWTGEHLRFLDGRSQWKTPEVTLERSLLVAELNHSYRFLLDFANNSSATRSISPEELTILGRKLQAAFERKSGKVEWVNPGISNDLSENTLLIIRSLSEESLSSIWSAYSQDPNKTNQTENAIKSCASPIELILYCYYNGIITPTTQFELHEQSKDPTISQMELRRLLKAIKTWLPLPLPPVQHKNFQRPSFPEEILFLINAGKSPTPELDIKGYQRLSDNSDALRYGGFEENLVASIDVITRNSWNEIITRRFDDNSALLDALIDYLQSSLPGTHHLPPRVRVECIGSAHSTTITHRVTQWLSDITQCFFSGAHSRQNRFVFQLSNKFLCLQFFGMKPLAHTFISKKLLLEHLEMEQSQYSPLIIDRNALKNHPLQIISKKSQGNRIDVFFRHFDIGMEYYVVDEKGSICYAMHRGQRNHHALKPLHLFLRSVLHRQVRTNPKFAADFGIYPINFCELIKTAKSAYIAQTKNITPDIKDIAKFEVKATAHFKSDGSIGFDYYCDDQEFRGQTFAQQLELVVAQHVLSRRTGNEHYPIYITDMDLSLVADAISNSGDLQISHYLKYRNKLEFQLNQAIGILLRA
jgi:adenylate cyclase class 1